jgi:hypothetical protein
MRRSLILACLWLVSALGCACSCSSSRSQPSWFVDQIENGHALLLSESGETKSVDARTLPPDAGEGSWITDGKLDEAKARAMREQIETKRRALSAGDDGRDIVLGR